MYSVLYNAIEISNFCQLNGSLNFERLTDFTSCECVQVEPARDFDQSDWLGKSLIVTLSSEFDQDNLTLYYLI